MLLLLVCVLDAQTDISFHHITTNNGLSDNNVTNATIDKYGYLWICTSEGLNRYDGRSMVTYYKEEHPELRNNNIREVVCDDKNRLWIRTFGGYISMLDEQRNWHSIVIKENGKELPIYNIVNSRSKGIILFRGSKQYRLKAGSRLAFERWHFDGDTLFETRLFYSSHITNDKMIWTTRNQFFIMDYAAGKIIYQENIQGINSAVAAGPNEVFITTNENGGLYKIDLTTGIITSLKHLRDQFGIPVFSNLQMIKKLDDGRYIITSDFAGIYIYNPLSGELTRFIHDPLNSRSISSNSYSNLVADSSGFVFVASVNSGLSYFNLKEKPAAWISNFKDEYGNIFDGYVNAILPSGTPNSYWLGCYNQLVRWNRKTNAANFYDYGSLAGRPNRGNDEILCLSSDAAGKIWVGTGNSGLVILSKDGKLLRTFSHQPANTQSLPDNRVNYLYRDDNNMYIATDSGVCIMDVNNYALQPIAASSALYPMGKMYCSVIWKDSRGRFWLGAGREGAFCFDPVKNTLGNYAKAKQSASNDIYAFAEDATRNIYIGSREGLIVIAGDSVQKIYNKTNGLRGDRCENILTDANGIFWIENGNMIIRFDPIKKSFAYFDEKSGFSPYGFRVRSGWVDTSGYLFFGSDKGLCYFKPQLIQQAPLSLKLSVNQVQVNQQIIGVNGAGKLEFDHKDNDVIFHISAIDLGKPKSILFRYRLVGYDKAWTAAQNISTVRYNSLRPGNYQFESMASTDGQKWVNALYPVTIAIRPAIWQTWWFRFIVALSLAIVFYFLLRARVKQIEARSEEKTKAEEMRAQALQYQLEIEQVVNYFATSLSGLQTVDDILWDVVRTCISQLGFQDCVIYFYNEDRTLLIQKAAYGPKNINYREIFNRIEIPPGSGIVGTVGLTGRAEVIADTSKDPRYIPDDAVRLSEIAVPIIGSNAVMGVIDSEHPTANFYTNRHLHILTTIANMVANKTEQLEAQAYTRQKEIELAQLQRDVATSQLTATRAQMNPHFIFNALNSIQQYILQGNTDDANKYLSRFSRLQREILHHCDRPFISLQKEMDMLRMYLELEQLRFNGSFDFDIKLTDEIDPEEIKIPPMMLQPFVENAIWHGLMPKKTNRYVAVSFWLDEEDDETLHCMIEDNGIGRQAAADLKANDNSPHPEHVSKGMALVYQRLKLMEQQSGGSFNVVVSDILNEEGSISGTRVELVFFIGY